MKRKLIIILAILAVCVLIASPVFAKEKVKIKITTDDSVFDNKGYIIIKLLNKNGREIRSNAKINYTITDQDGFYKWVCKSYNSGIRVKYDFGKYKVNVKFFGDSHYKKAKKTKTISLKSNFDPYTYYENHNWGLNQEVDDYFDYNYWGEEIYDDPDDPENEAWDI